MRFDFNVPGIATEGMCYHIQAASAAFEIQGRIWHWTDGYMSLIVDQTGDVIGRVQNATRTSREWRFRVAELQELPALTFKLRSVEVLRLSEQSESSAGAMNWRAGVLASQDFDDAAVSQRLEAGTENVWKIDLSDGTWEHVRKSAARMQSGDASTRAAALAEEAQHIFFLLDTDKDGVISPDEWQKSRKIRSMFEEAGIDVSVPMKSEDVIRHYVEISVTLKSTPRD